MDRPAGSYVEDKKGNIKPNLDDEAMKAREGLKKKSESKEEDG